jgi:hypothetical protein
VTALAFLAAGLVLIAIGITAVLMRARQPTGARHSVRSFQREMRALDPAVRRPRGEASAPPLPSGGTVRTVETADTVAADTVDTHTVDTDTVAADTVDTDTVAADTVDTEVATGSAAPSRESGV